MNLERFKPSSAGQLVQVWQADPPYWAFVPHPLPPMLAFDHELIGALSTADRALGELAGLGRLLPNPNLLIQPFMRREAVLSSRIEGTQTGLAELYAFEVQQLSLFGGVESPQRLADAREVANYVTAMQYGLKRLKTLPMSLRLIREVHERLMKGVRGEQARPGKFRERQNYIGAPGCTLDAATFVPPPVDQMNVTLDAFEKFLHRDDPLPPLIRLACIHYQFEAIHPFIDGNGRIGRLLITLLLNDWQLLPVPLLYLSAYFERHRDTYDDLLQAVSERGEWPAWLLFFLRGVADQSREALAKAKQLQDVQYRWHQAVIHARSSALLFRLIDSLFQAPIITIPEAARLLEVTWRSAKLTVQKLVEAKILTPRDNAKYGKTYVAMDIIRIVVED